MYEDTSFYNINIIKKNQESPKMNFYENKIINGNSVFNNFNNSFHNNFIFNNFFKKENYLANINNNLNKSLENKIKGLNLFPNGFGNLRQFKFIANNNEIKLSNKLIINNYILTNEFKEDKNISNKEKNQLFVKRLTTQKFLTDNKNNERFRQTLKFISKQKGRKKKNLRHLKNESKHTKYSSDNMMRKLKNKVIESSRLLVNKILKEEIKNDTNIKFKIFNKEFRKIKGSFGQQLSIKYNCWFYQIKIKDIFSMEMSNKYTTIEKSSNNQLIKYLFSPINDNIYNKTKNLLNTPFHQFYHDIFLNENKNWKKFYGINEKDNKYQIEHFLKNLQSQEGDANEDNIIYINDINKLAHNYENFFLEKKPRNVDYNSKKNNIIKEFTNNSLNDKYMLLLEEVKQLKNFYDSRNILNDKLLSISLDEKSVEIFDNLLMKNNNYKNINENQFIKKISNKNRLDDFFGNNDKASKIGCNINNISLEEDKKENYIEDICRIINNKKEKIFNISKEKQLKNIYEKQKYCNKKRKKCEN